MDDGEVRTLLRCAYLYYKEQITQAMIAKKLGLSESKVSRLLKTAREDFVRIQIKVPLIQQLELDLCHRFGLQDAVVVAVGEPSQTRAQVGEAAARYFERLVRDQVRVAVCGGSTLYHFADALIPHPRTLTIYSLSMSGPGATYLTAYVVAGIVCAKCQPTTVAYGLQLPFPTNRAMAAEIKTLLTMSLVRQIYQETLDVDIVFTGIEALGPDSRLADFAQAYGLNLKQIRREGVGNLNYQVFDENGQILPYDWYAAALAFPAERLREMAAHPTKRAIAVTGGREKVESIAAALKGRFFDTLITDELVARALLKDG